MKINSMIINAIIDMLTDTSMKINNKKLGTSIAVSQGSVLSPAPFNLLINYLLK
jgi:hypothetical protein